MTPRSAEQVVCDTRHLLLEFDGPICAIFAGAPAAEIAERLRHRLQSAGFTLPADASAATDPLEVFQHAAMIGSDAAECAQRELADLEIRAAATARPTDGAAELIMAARQTGRTVTIVSNNSSPAIVTYLAGHRVPPHIRSIYGRDDADPAHMKPHPYRVLQAVRGLNSSPAQCVMIGDSPSDVTAGHRAGIPVIGYANKPGKRERLADAQADAIIAHLTELTSALHATADEC